MLDQYHLFHKNLVVTYWKVLLASLTDGLLSVVRNCLWCLAPLSRQSYTARRDICLLLNTKNIPAVSHLTLMNQSSAVFIFPPFCPLPCRHRCPALAWDLAGQKHIQGKELRFFTVSMNDEWGAIGHPIPGYKFFRVRPDWKKKITVSSQILSCLPSCLFHRSYTRLGASSILEICYRSHTHP